MASSPSPQPPPQAPPPPPASASGEEARRQVRVFGYRGGRWGHGWSWFWGLVLILVGGYYLLKNLGLLEWVKGDVIWPILLIFLGLWLIASRALRDR